MNVIFASLDISGFRCFGNLNVEPLARVNLIAGPNNVGKTALLEALWMFSHATAPREALRIPAWRDSNDYGRGEFFADLFFQYEAGLAINLQVQDKRGSGVRSLDITRQYRSQQTLIDWASVSEAEMEDDVIAGFDFDNELVFQYIDESGIEYLTSAWLDAETVSGKLRPTLRDTRKSASSSRFPCVFEHPKSRYSHRSLAALFGRAQFAGYVSSIETVIRLLEPRLKRLETITNSRGVPAIHADIGVGRPLPISVMGEGTKRLLALSLAFLKAQNGVLLVDEVENGLHHSVLADVWKNLDWLSREFNVQVFATTHSYECVRSANDAFSELESHELHFHRLNRKRDQVRAVTYTKDMLDTNIEYFWELR